METILVGISRLITIASTPVLAWEVLTMETRSVSMGHLATVVAVSSIALAITVRAEICEQERNHRRNRK